MSSKAREDVHSGVENPGYRSASRIEAESHGYEVGARREGYYVTRRGEATRLPLYQRASLAWMAASAYHRGEGPSNLAEFDEAHGRAQRAGSLQRDDGAPRDFATWFDEVERFAVASALGQLMTKRGWHVHHTGGGLLAWELTIPGHHAWVCDDSQGLGDDVRSESDAKKVWLVGVYSEWHDEYADAEVLGIAAALEWCDEVLKNPAPHYADRAASERVAAHG